MLDLRLNLIVLQFVCSDVAVCWRIVDLNNNSVVNRSCDGPLSGGLFLTPGISLSQGQYIAQVNVTNDVSAVSGQSQVLSVYSGGGKWSARISYQCRRKYI